MKLKDLTGQRFGRWVVIERDLTKQTEKAFWLCQCACGGSSSVNGCTLRSGESRSCGCLMREQTSRRETTHGLSNTPEYISWRAVKARCLNPSHEAYKSYGGQGVTICDRWLKSFEAFLADMGPRPSPQHSIDRHPNKAGDYEPTNCRWATPEEQANNRRTNRIILLEGTEVSLAEACRLRGLNYRTVFSKLARGACLGAVITGASEVCANAMRSDMTEINTIEEFQAACDSHDLTHDYSDDGSAWASGARDLERIRKAAEKLPRDDVERIWNAAVDRKLVERARANFYWRWPAGDAR